MNADMNDLEFYLNWYNKEEERRTSIENSLNIPIGILTAIFILQFFLIKEFDYKDSSNVAKYFLISFIAISFISNLITTFYLLKSYHNIYKGFEYKGLPYPSKLLNYKQELIKYYKDHAANFPGINGEQEFEKYLLNKYVTYIDQNAYNNDCKSKSLHSSRRYIFISIFSILLAFAPFMHNFFKHTEKTDNVQQKDFNSLNNRILKLEDYVKRAKSSFPATAPPTAGQTYQGRK